MSVIKKEDLNNFKVLYKKNFGVDISEKEALDLAISLLNLVRAVLLPNYTELGERK